MTLLSNNKYLQWNFHVNAICTFDICHVNTTLHWLSNWEWFSSMAHVPMDHKPSTYGPGLGQVAGYTDSCRYHGYITRPLSIPWWLFIRVRGYSDRMLPSSRNTLCHHGWYHTVPLWVAEQSSASTPDTCFLLRLQTTLSLIPLYSHRFEKIESWSCAAVIHLRSVTMSQVLWTNILYPDESRLFQNLYELVYVSIVISCRLLGCCWVNSGGSKSMHLAATS